MNTLFCLTQESEAFHFRVESIPRFLMMKFTVGECEGENRIYPSLWGFSLHCIYLFIYSHWVAYISMNRIPRLISISL